MSDFKKPLHQYKTSLAFSLFNGGEKSRVSKILDDIDRHEHLAKAMFEAGQQSMQVKIDCLQVELKGAQERSQILLNHKNAMVGKLQSEIDELQKRVDAVLKKLEGDLMYVEQDQRKNFEFLQMTMIRCLRDDIKTLRGDND